MTLNIIKLVGLLLFLAGPLFYTFAWYPSFREQQTLNTFFLARIRHVMLITGAVYLICLLIQLWQREAVTGQYVVLNLILVPLLFFAFLRQPGPKTHRQRLVSGVLVMMILLVAATDSHAAADPGWLPYASQATHLFTAVIWAGGLCYFTLLPWSQLAAGNSAICLYELDRRFYRLVLFMFIAMVVSGAVLAFVHVHSEAALKGTPYGQVLVWKLGLVTLITISLCVHLPGSGRLLKNFVGGAAGKPVSFQNYRRLITLEAIVAIAILCASAVIRGQDPPDTAPFLNPQTLTLVADGQAVRVSMQPVAGMINSVRFEIFVPSQFVADSTLVFYRLSLPSAGLEQEQQEAIRVSADSYQGESTFPLPGDWQIEIEVSAPGGRPLQLVSGLPVPAQPLVGDLATYLSLDAMLYNRANMITAVTGLLLVLIYGVWILKAGKAAVPDWAILGGAGGVLCGFYLLFSIVLVKTYPSTYETNPLPLSGSVVARGQQSYTSTCADCHGTDGKGDGPWSLENRGGPIPDLGSPHMDVHTDGEIYWWISRGIPELDMPASDVELAEAQKWEIINYIRSLRHGTIEG